jgi:hypothetical protein
MESPVGVLATVELPQGHIRLELLKVKGDLEQELSRWVLDCRRCNRRVHWVSGIGVTPGHWAHAEPAPDHPPVLIR